MPDANPNTTDADQAAGAQTPAYCPADHAETLPTATSAPRALGAISATVAAAQDRLGLTFNDPGLLALALRHASSSESRADSNERLEFLGDAILGAVACERIFDRHPDLLEGEMTKIKSAVVSRRACARIAARLGLEELMDVGKGMQMQPRLPSSIAAGVFEAVLGALHLDRGFGAARAFLLPLIEPFIEEAAASAHQQNYKSLLQQHAQSALAATPHYRVIEETGPDHAKAFRVAVELAGVRHPARWGQSKKQAEQLAAHCALVALGVVEPPAPDDLTLHQLHHPPHA